MRDRDNTARYSDKSDIGDIGDNDNICDKVSIEVSDINITNKKVSVIIVISEVNVRYTISSFLIAISASSDFFSEVKSEVKTNIIAIKLL